MDEITVITAEYEALLRGMVRNLADATGLHSRWVASTAMQACADTAIGELLSTVDALRTERDAAVVRAEMAEAELAQLRKDALFVLGRWHTDPATLGSTHLPGLDDDEAAALTDAAVRALSVGDRGFNVALRNVLSLAELPPVERD